MTTTDWFAWHDRYDQQDESLSRRLVRVQDRIREALNNQPHGPITVLSMCAGQGRDLLQPLAVHPRRSDVRALLVEQDPRNTAVASRIARDAGLEGIEVVTADASVTTAYASVVPADIALVCGVFGNITNEAVERTVNYLPQLVRTGGTVIWTRSRRLPDLTPTIRNWFTAANFREIGFDTEERFLYAVGTHVLTGRSEPFQSDIVMFRFTGDGSSALL